MSTKRERLTAGSERRAEVAASLRHQYRNGYTVRQLVELTGRSYGNVHRLLKDSGAEMRPRGSRTRKGAE